MERIAMVLGKEVGKVEEWIQDVPAFRLAWYEGSELADATVAHALYHRAIGYEMPEEQLFYNARADKVVRAKTVKRFAPDTAAATMWLTNRQGSTWKTRITEELTGPGGAPLPPPIFNIMPVQPASREQLEARTIDAEVE